MSSTLTPHDEVGSIASMRFLVHKTSHAVRPRLRQPVLQRPMLLGTTSGERSLGYAKGAWLPRRGLCGEVMRSSRASLQESWG